MKKVLFKDRKKGGIYLYKPEGQKGKVFQYPGRSRAVGTLLLGNTYLNSEDFIWEWNMDYCTDFYETTPEQVEAFLKADRGRFKIIDAPQQETTYSLF